MENGKAIFEVRHVTKYYRKGTARECRAVDDVSLTIAPASFTVFTGPSGSGKTTLLAILGALEQPSTGQVLFQGRDLVPLWDGARARVRRRLGYVFQDFSLIPALPVWENITYPLIPRGMPRAARYARARELLTRFGLLDKLHAAPSDLSGGEQQRVAIARALAGEPEVILADEPTSNLDPEAGGIILSLLQELHAAGRAVILASHEPRAASQATAVYELHQGKLKS